MQVDYETDTRIHVKIYDAESDRFEVPDNLFPRPGKSRDVTADSAAYEFTLVQDPVSFKVSRKSDGMVLFDTSSTGGGSLINPLIFEEQYLELSTRIPQDAHIYGLGEVVHSFRRDAQWTRQTMWARDTPTPKDQNVYGSHPFYMEMRDGKAHGVLLLNANGMDVFIRPGALTYKTIGGVLDFYIFVGPTPADVIHQYYQVIGNPHMIPYWYFYLVSPIIPSTI
jgi:alpha-glucosidase (family GH31 glycosyl hydrolase)